MEPVLRALSGLALGWIQRACSFARSGILAGDTGTRADHACATCCFTRWAVRTGAGGGATGQLVTRVLNQGCGVTVLGMVAEIERKFIRERQQAGIEAEG